MVRRTFLSRLVKGFASSLIAASSALVPVASGGDTSEVRRVRIEVDAKGRARIELPNGKVVHSWSAYRHAVTKMGLDQASLLKAGLQLEMASNDTGSSAGSRKPNLWVGKYFVRLSWEYHYVGGCIAKNVWHLGLLINDSTTGREVLNLHLCSWWDGGGPQFGAYNSANGWCVRSGLNYSAVWDAIFKACMNVGTGTVMAAAIAAAVAPIAIGILAL